MLCWCKMRPISGITVCSSCISYVSAVDTRSYVSTLPWHLQGQYFEWLSAERHLDPRFCDYTDAAPQLERTNCENASRTGSIQLLSLEVDDDFLIIRPSLL